MKIPVKIYEHEDCNSCIWVGRYIQPGQNRKIANIYVCWHNPESNHCKDSYGWLIFRYSDEPSDYSCRTIPKESKPWRNPGQDIKPYDHDCKACVWVGWYGDEDEALANIWFCPRKGEPDWNKGNLIIRNSSKASDCWSHMVGGGDASIQPSIALNPASELGKGWLADQEERRRRFAED